MNEFHDGVITLSDVMAATQYRLADLGAAMKLMFPVEPETQSVMTIDGKTFNTVKGGHQDARKSSYEEIDQFFQNRAATLTDVHEIHKIYPDVQKVEIKHPVDDWEIVHVYFYDGSIQKVEVDMNDFRRLP